MEHETPGSRQTSAGPSPDSERVPLARVTHQLDQQAAALLDGKIAERWGSLNRSDWVTGNGFLTPDLFRMPSAILAEHHDPADRCEHAVETGFAADLCWWPATDDRILCDECVYGPGGIWSALQYAVSSGLLVLNCEACFAPIADEFLVLVAPHGPLTIMLAVCRPCVEGNAPAEVLP